MYRVLEIGANWSGPMVGQYLRSLGCDVIRLESREHLDAVRQLPAPRDCGRKLPDATSADNPYFAQLNAGKRSIELDMSTAEGLEQARTLAAGCDVVVENLSPGAVDRLGLSYAELARRNPALCMLSMPALHPGDPREGLRGYAPVFTGLGGLEIEVGYSDEVTGMLMTGWGDPAGGMTGLLGLLAALHRRERSALGSYVLVSQLKAVTWQLVVPFAAWRAGRTVKPAPVKVIQSSEPDSWIAVHLSGDDQNLAGGQSLESWAARLTPLEILTACAQGGHAAALVERVETASAAERIRRRGIVTDISSEAIGTWPRYHVPWLLDGRVPPVHGAPPGLGEHTDDVLTEPPGSSTVSA